MESAQYLYLLVLHLLIRLLFQYVRVLRAFIGVRKARQYSDFDQRPDLSIELLLNFYCNTRTCLYLNFWTFYIQPWTLSIL